MATRRILERGTELVLVVVVLSLVAGQLLGYPVLLGYVETGSMAPTMEPGDGFVAVPTALDGDIEEGDVIVFRAEELQGGGLTTHRVVGRTDRGFITRGDANPFTDQDGSEPPVKRAQIVAKALQVGGTTVVIPNLGTAVMAVQSAVSETQRQIAIRTGSRALLGTQGLTYLLFGLSVALYVVDLLLSAETNRSRDRSRKRETGVSTRLIVAALAAILVVAATSAMVVPAGTQEFGIVSAEFDSEQPTVIPTGESSTIEYRVPNAGVVPVVAYLEPASDGVAVDPKRVHVPGRGERNASVTLTAPPETGYYRLFLTEHRYLAVLPSPVMDALYRAHPWAPIVVIDAMLAGFIGVLGRALLGTGRIRDRHRETARKKTGLLSLLD